MIAIEPNDRCRGRNQIPACVEPKYGAERATAILAACWKLEDLTDIGALLRLMD